MLTLPCLAVLGVVVLTCGASTGDTARRRGCGGVGIVSGKIPTPSKYQSPRFRWWLPGGWIDPNEIVAEVKAIAAAGFGGAEIGDVQDSVKASLDPKIYGWAQPRWNKAIEAAYEEADSLGIHLDQTIGPHWPTGVPGYTPDSPETSKELAHGQSLLLTGQTFSGALPLPVSSPSGKTTFNANVTSTPRLVAVLGAKTNATSVNATVIGFQQSSVINLAGMVVDGNLTWTPPDNNTYIIVAVYGRGTGQIQNMYDMGSSASPLLTYPFPAYIVDHLSTAGVQATVKYWDEHILTDTMRSLLRKSGGSLFEDSLELKLTQYWTINFMQEFKTRRGYDLTPYLLYVLKDTNTFSGDEDTAARIQFDFYATVTDLYIDYRLGGLEKFAHSLDLKMRVQPYSGSFDSALAAAHLDIPEGESLGFEGDPDGFRSLATGRDISGRTTILSDELGAYMGEAYGVTWSFLLGTMNFDFALGVSQSVIHGFPYRDSPSSVWPGFAPFTPLGTSSNGFAEAWGPRQPQWALANNASIYMTRSQMLMQSGKPSVDIAILNTEYGLDTFWADRGLTDAGYSYQFPTPKLLEEYNVTVQNALLALNGPAYKALVVNNISALNVDGAQLLEQYARAGLPIIVVGDAPSTPQSFVSNGDIKAENSKIAEAFDAILKLNTSKQVTAQAGVPAALKALGVLPSIRYAMSSNVTTYTLRRNLEGGFLYWTYSNEPTSQLVQLEGEGVPLKLNLWSGEVTPYTLFDSIGGYTTVNITLAKNAAEVVFLGKTNPWGAKSPTIHAISSDAEVVAIDTSLYIRATANGSYHTALSNGQNLITMFDNVPDPVFPTDWTLTVQDWAPVYVNETGLNSSLTVKTWLDPMNLTASGGVLPSWPNITGLESASGVGVYETKFSASLQFGQGIYFKLGDVEGSWTLSINNKTVEETDFFASKPIDITKYVDDGVNNIKVTVYTTLWNKLRETWPAIYASLEAQNIGLLGPVELIYFAQQGIDS